MLLTAGATLGAALLIVLQNLWLSRDRDGYVRAGYAAAGGVMTLGAAGVVTATGPLQQVALTARGGGTMVAAMLIVPVLGMTTDRLRAPRWLAGAMAVWAAVGLVLTPLPVVHAVDGTGGVVYGPLFVPITAPLALGAAVWMGMVVRASRRWSDRLALLVGVGLPAGLFFTVVAHDPTGSDGVWVWMLAPLLLAVEVIHWQNLRASDDERARSEQERARLAQETARANHELQAAVRVRNDLLVAASHELRTPLTAILGYAETLDAHGEMLEAEARSACAKLVVENATRLRIVVDQMLAARELAVESTVAQPEPLRLQPLLRTTVSLYAELDARTVVDCPDDVGVLADPLHLNSIMTALISNAAQHGAPPVLITVRTTDQDTVAIVVQDSGPGVPAEVSAELFTPFTQGTRGVSRASGGLGLGLYNAASLAALNGGTLALVPSTTGACFELRLPAADHADLITVTVELPGLSASGNGT